MISVVIPSDGRELLARAVASVEALPEGVEILVVDNSPAGNLVVPGAHVIREAVRNIAVVRNAGVVAARGRGRALVFLDDDQALAPGALGRLVAALDGADVAVGALFPVADGVRLAGGLAAAAHTRELDLPPGAVIGLLSRFGKPLFRLSTGVCAFRRECFAQARFDPAFGVTGGEDTDLFCALYRRGMRLVWVPQAQGAEEVPAHRREDGYQLRRIRRESASYRAIRLRYSEWPRLTWLELALIGVAQVAAGIVLGRGALRERGLGKLGLSGESFAVDLASR